MLARPYIDANTKFSPIISHDSFGMFQIFSEGCALGSFIYHWQAWKSFLVQKHAQVNGMFQRFRPQGI